jgi:aconitate hydratase
VIAQGFERIHRSNLVGMGVLPLELAAGESVAALGLTGREVFSIRGISGGIRPGQDAVAEAVREDGTRVAFTVRVRIDVPAEVDYHRHGGILQMVLRQMMP